jgi:chromodomain-helicase-DNA-binding protein 7
MESDDSDLASDAGPSSHSYSAFPVPSRPALPAAPIDITFPSFSNDRRNAPIKGTTQRILTHRVLATGETEYFVKKWNMSYRDCAWVSRATVRATISGQHTLRKYESEPSTPISEPYFDPEFTKVQRIIAERHQGEPVFLVKWRNLDYTELTWETSSTLTDDRLISQFRDSEQPPAKSTPLPRPSEWIDIQSVPTSRSGRTPRPYQMDGLNFLANCWFNRRGCILADEMGLGKTVQIVLFLNYLATVHQIAGPFLAFGPLSTLPHWAQEFADWSDLVCLTYSGAKEEREIQKQYEFFYRGTRTPKFQVFLTSYQFVMQQRDVLQSFDWRCMVCDEGHRLKNPNAKLVQQTMAFRTEHRILVTGTPIQNDLSELWSLLHFLDPGRFDNLDSFVRKYQRDEEGIRELQIVLSSLMLRREKADVEKSLAPLEEIVIESSLTPHQTMYCRALIEHNASYLSRGLHRGNASTMRNVCMELRKVCNHPYLIKGAEDQILLERRALLQDDQVSPRESLIRSAGKMILLDKLLAKLKEDGHRVLIFSQMLAMLDIIADFLADKCYQFQRIDGMVRGVDRQAAIDHFNAPGSEDFVFLLVTQAGGMGINLASADTVIIYDSAWNPQNDIQAIARSHRIGQTREVKAFRFITARRYEFEMFKKASEKRSLNHAILEGGEKNERVEVLDQALRKGLGVLDDADDSTEQYCEEDIDTIISRSQRIQHNSSGESMSSKAVFTHDDRDLEEDLSSPGFWQKYLPTSGENEVARIVSDSLGERLSTDLSGSTDANEDIGEMEGTVPADVDSWTRLRFQNLLAALWKWGIGRWQLIAETARLASCEIAEIKAVVHVVLRWLLDASVESFKTIQTIHKSLTVKEHAKFEALFVRRNRDDYEPLVAAGTTARLKRLDLLHHLRCAVSTCPDPPSEIPIPDVPKLRLEG